MKGKYQYHFYLFFYSCTTFSGSSQQSGYAHLTDADLGVPAPLAYDSFSEFSAVTEDEVLVFTAGSETIRRRCRFVDKGTLPY